MKLRTRILSGFAVVMVLVVGFGVVVVAAQRNQLIDQLDRRLAAVVPLDRPAPPPNQSDLPPANPDQPISDIFIAAVLADGTIDLLVQGQLLDDVPDLQPLVGFSLDGRTFLTIDSVDGATTFRGPRRPDRRRCRHDRDSGSDHRCRRDRATPRRDIVRCCFARCADSRHGRMVDRAAGAATDFGDDRDCPGDLIG